jgi:Uma2 family endonuclease
MRGEWTEEDYLRLPSNRGVELSDGCLEFLPMPSELHQLLVALLYEALVAFVRPRRLGLVLFSGIPVQLWSQKMREPDVVFMHRDHASRRRTQFWEGADIAVEVVSPEGRSRDLEVKRAEYAQAGIPEYWIVEPEARQVLVLILDAGSYRVHGEFRVGDEVTSVVLPGFSLSVEALFASAEQTF